VKKIVLLSAVLLGWTAAMRGEAAAAGVAADGSVRVAQTKAATVALPLAATQEVQYRGVPRPVWHAPATTSSGLVPLSGQTFTANKSAGAKLTVLGGSPAAKTNTTTAISGTGMSRKH
jgi:hypothetical protein